MAADVSAARLASGHPLDGEHTTAALLYYLWTRDHLGRGPAGVIVPETIVIQGRRPVAWFYSAADGTVQRRNRRDLTPKAILSAMLDGEGDAASAPRRRCDIVAELVRPGSAAPSDGGKARIVEYLTAAELERVLSQPLPLSGTLQRFTEPMGAHNHVIRATWSPTVLVAERRTNALMLFPGATRAPGADSALGTPDATLAAERAKSAGFGPATARAVTFDGPPHCAPLAALSGKVMPAALQELCETMAFHVAQVSGLRVRLCRAVVDCKLGADGRLWLLRLVSARIQGPQADLTAVSVVTGTPAVEKREVAASEALNAIRNIGRKPGSAPSTGARKRDQRQRLAQNSSLSSVRGALMAGLSQPAPQGGRLDTTSSADPSVAPAKLQDLLHGVLPVAAPGMQPLGGEAAVAGAMDGTDASMSACMVQAQAAATEKRIQQAREEGVPEWLIRSAAQTGVPVQHPRWHRWVLGQRTDGVGKAADLPSSARPSQAFHGAERDGSQAGMPESDAPSTAEPGAATAGHAAPLVRQRPLASVAVRAERSRVEAVPAPQGLFAVPSTGVLLPLGSNHCPSCGAALPVAGGSKAAPFRVAYKDVSSHYVALLQHLELSADQSGAEAGAPLQHIHDVAMSRSASGIPAGEGLDPLPSAHRWPFGRPLATELPDRVRAAAGGVGLFGVSVAKAMGVWMAGTSVESPEEAAAMVLPAAEAVSVVPPTLRVLHPTMTGDSYLSAYAPDPLFQFKTASVCEACFLVFATMAQLRLSGQAPAVVLSSVMGRRATRPASAAPLGRRAGRKRGLASDGAADSSRRTRRPPQGQGEPGQASRRPEPSAAGVPPTGPLPGVVVSDADEARAGKSSRRRPASAGPRRGMHAPRQRPGRHPAAAHGGFTSVHARHAGDDALAWAIRDHEHATSLDDAERLAAQWASFASGGKSAESAAKVFAAHDAVAPPRFALRLLGSDGLPSAAPARPAAAPRPARQGELPPRPRPVPQSAGPGVLASDSRARLHLGHPLMHLQDAAIPSTVLAGSDVAPSVGVSRHLRVIGGSDPSSGLDALRAASRLPHLSNKRREEAGTSAEVQRYLLSAPGDHMPPWQGEHGPGAPGHTSAVLWSPSLREQQVLDARARMGVAESCYSAPRAKPTGLLPPQAARRRDQGQSLNSGSWEPGVSTSDRSEGSESPGHRAGQPKDVGPAVTPPMTYLGILGRAQQSLRATMGREDLQIAALAALEETARASKASANKHSSEAAAQAHRAASNATADKFICDQETKAAARAADLAAKASRDPMGVSPRSHAASDAAAALLRASAAGVRQSEGRAERAASDEKKAETSILSLEERQARREQAVLALEQARAHRVRTALRKAPRRREPPSATSSETRDRNSVVSIKRLLRCDALAAEFAPRLAEHTQLSGIVHTALVRRNAGDTGAQLRQRLQASGFVGAAIPTISAAMQVATAQAVRKGAPLSEQALAARAARRMVDQAGIHLVLMVLRRTIPGEGLASQAPAARPFGSRKQRTPAVGRVDGSGLPDEPVFALDTRDCTTGHCASRYLREEDVLHFRAPAVRPEAACAAGPTPDGASAESVDGAFMRVAIRSLKRWDQLSSRLSSKGKSRAAMGLGKYAGKEFLEVGSDPGSGSGLGLESGGAPASQPRRRHWPWQALPPPRMQPLGFAAPVSHAVVPSGDGSFALVFVSEHAGQSSESAESGRVKFCVSVAWLARASAVETRSELSVSEALAVLRAVALGGTLRKRSPLDCVVAHRAGDGRSSKPGVGTVSRDGLEEEGDLGVAVESGGLLRPCGWAADPATRQHLVGFVREAAARRLLAALPRAEDVPISGASRDALCLQFSAARAEAADGERTDSPLLLDPRPPLLAGQSHAGVAPVERPGTVATRVVVYGKSRIVRHSLRVVPSVSPEVHLESFSQESGESFSTQLFAEQLADPKFNPFVKADAVELLAALEEDFGHAHGWKDPPTSAGLLPGTTATKQRTVETEAVLSRGTLLACFVSLEAPGVVASGSVGGSHAHLVAVRMLEAPSTAAGPDSPAGGAGAQAAAAAAGGKPGSPGLTDAQRPRFRLLVSLLARGTHGTPANRCRLRDLASPARWVREPLDSQERLPAGYRLPDDASADFAARCDGDGLLRTAQLADGPGPVRVPALHRPDGVDLDTIWRTLPFSRCNDRRLNAALEVVADAD